MLASWYWPFVPLLGWGILAAWVSFVVFVCIFLKPSRHRADDLFILWVGTMLIVVVVGGFFLMLPILLHTDAVDAVQAHARIAHVNATLPATQPGFKQLTKDNPLMPPEYETGTMHYVNTSGQTCTALYYDDQHDNAVIVPTTLTCS